jgi:hypothetical protein
MVRAFVIVAVLKLKYLPNISLRMFMVRKKIECLLLVFLKIASISGYSLYFYIGRFIARGE